MVNCYDYIRAAALIAGFAAGCRQRKNAIIADMVFTGWFGVCLYFFTQQFMEQQVSINIGKLSVFGFRVLGAWLLGSVVMWLLCRKSRDESVHGAILWSRIVGKLPLFGSNFSQTKSLPKATLSDLEGMMMVFLLMLFSQLTYTKVFKDRHLWFSVLFSGLLWMSSVIQMIRTRPPVGRREEKGAVSVITRVYFLFLFLFGMGFMAFPKLAVLTVTESTDDIHMYIARLDGALIFGNIFIAWYVPSFRYNEDKKSFFISQIVTVALFWGDLLFAYWQDTVDRSHVMNQVVMTVPFLCPLVALLLMLRSEHIVYNNYSLRSRS